MNGYDLADEVFRNIGLNEKHEISLNDTIRVISFWGFNEEASKETKIGFVCYCARERVKKIFESALVWGDFTLFDEMVNRFNCGAKMKETMNDSDRPTVKWIDDGDTLICNQCGTAYNRPIFHNGWNFCSNCGAKMEKMNE